ncbi:xylulose 5-phosphate 3-epimerase [Microbulbifer magnicolonia]|uniref:xylulose 5-phosphate 3-epimerase n=1 Tax=Microbulbifer magnicolonia TaxID=3109744 RepID=UPI002B409570|nr:xylulose 5-phosphate 3-epimerase [Microbulbifer sp. GG15]
MNQRTHQRHQQERQARSYREHDTDFAAWAAGYGVIRHRADTQVKVFRMACDLEQRGAVADRSQVFRLLGAADRLARAAMWLVVHMTYAKRVCTDGRPLAAADFKADPQGHTGGSLNMVPGYIGYLAANALCGLTRSWLMGQGHCVAAIDACNLLVGNMEAEHAARYSWTDEGLTRFVRDFYSYALDNRGRPESPLGSHVNVNTAGGILEGGYLGFAEVQYVHMPLPGERLVAFLSDGAFEEQRGSDWAPRWWRAADCGLVTPIMIANGRRIEQRSTLFQQGGVDWFAAHLRLNGFDPLLIDGTDPAAFAWAIFEAEERLQGCADAVANGSTRYPVPLHYVIAEAPKGYGFPGAGTNRAHGLPLAGNPAQDDSARGEFTAGAAELYVEERQLREALPYFADHAAQGRVREKDHPLGRRDVVLAHPLLPDWRPVGGRESPMAALDEYFVAITGANPEWRVRVGNPDELHSNRFTRTLEQFRHRVFVPEAGSDEAVDGAVITALNEEAVACAALGNKGGINLVVTYEAFAVKMLGILRQELIFARHQKEAGRPPQWLSVPFLLSSHTWENGKNEQSHQDPTLCEALLGEMSDTSVVRFPVDANSALAALADCYRRQGELHALVVPKRELPVLLDGEQAQQLVRDGALLVEGNPTASVRLVAVGAYQLQQCWLAQQRLAERGIDAALICLLEPGRFRRDFRDEWERRAGTDTALVEELFRADASVTMVASHTRPEALAGLLPGGGQQILFGYRNRGGTLDTEGMLFANGCSWLHLLQSLAGALDVLLSEWLGADELTALEGRTDPRPLLRFTPC